MKIKEDSFLKRIYEKKKIWTLIGVIVLVVFDVCFLYYKCRGIGNSNVAFLSSSNLVINFSPFNLVMLLLTFSLIVLFIFRVSAMLIEFISDVYVKIYNFFAVKKAKNTKEKFDFEWLEMFYDTRVGLVISIPILIVLIISRIQDYISIGEWLGWYVLVSSIFGFSFYVMTSMIKK